MRKLSINGAGFAWFGDQHDHEQKSSDYVTGLGQEYPGALNRPTAPRVLNSVPSSAAKLRKIPSGIFLYHELSWYNLMFPPGRETVEVNETLTFG